MFVNDKQVKAFESNVNYDLGKTMYTMTAHPFPFESNVNYDLGKTVDSGELILQTFESNVNYDLGKTLIFSSASSFNV